MPFFRIFGVRLNGRTKGHGPYGVDHRRGKSAGFSPDPKNRDFLTFLSLFRSGEKARSILA